MLHLFSIFDKKTQTYGDPFPVVHGEIAIRGYQEATATTGTFLFKNPYDYQLCKVGTFDQETGALATLETPLVVFQNKPEK